MSRFTVLALFLLSTATVSAEPFEDLDRLHEEDRQQQVLARIEAELQTTTAHARRAELLWRKARAQLTLADYGTWSGEIPDREAIELLRIAESYADEAIQLNPDAPNPYFWKAATMGLRGQLRGVLNSLFMASDVRDYAEATLQRHPQHPEAHYLLGQLYRELPRRPLSFGNRDRAVQYGRRAVELHEREYRQGVVGVRYFDLYTQLADSLWRRNNRGDRDEAVAMLRSNIADLEALRSPTTRERKDLQSARELLAAWI
ncbi:MAG: hypothetical protein EA384_13415 [Spirochaetaceae bacterium]|nr:MAG: hypothetical protein EA384_13415 [Spirochaetaceae bacterium]